MTCLYQVCQCDVSVSGGLRVGRVCVRRVSVTCLCQVCQCDVSVSGVLV